MQPSTVFYAASLILVSHFASGETNWQGYVTLGTEYNYRGLQYTQEDAAASAMLEYVSDYGVYAGLWLGHVDLPNSALGSEELDYLLGYAHSLTPRLAVDTTLIHYSFPSAHTQADYDWNEWQLALHFDQQWTLRLGINNNWLARDKSARMVEATYRHTLPLGFSYDFTLGYNDIENIVGTGYRYHELGINHSLKPLQLRLTFTGADSRAATVFGTIKTENRWAASVTWVF
jgi:uncharacterized protein (TIGR02001 family)